MPRRSGGYTNMRWWMPPASIAWPICMPIRTGTCVITCGPFRVWRKLLRLAGYASQYQVNLDPNRLRAYGIPVSRVVEAVREGNSESSGRLLEFGGTEYMVRGRGYARSLEDFANIPLSVSETGSQIRIKDVGQVGMGPDLRRGLADLDGMGEVVSGIVVMRNGENALECHQPRESEDQRNRAGTSGGREDCSGL